MGKHYIIPAEWGFRQFDLIDYITFPDFILMNKMLPAHTITPENIENVFNDACLLHKNGEIKEALEVYRAILSILPESSLLHFNSGLALFELGQFQDAEDHYKKAVQFSNDDPDIHYNRGLNFRRLERFKDAVLSFENAFTLGDATIDTLYNLALSNQDMGDSSEAERLYRIILQQSPGHLSSLNNYAYLCHKSDEPEKAIHLYQQLLKFNPEHQAARHMLNSLSGKTPDTAPLDYVESVFDNYAKEFEHSLLDKLQYKTPAALRLLYKDAASDYPVQQALDLGCGTGLAGVEFKDCCQKLSGIDISEEMLKIAQEKNIYNKLIKDDILHFLQSCEQDINLIIAADVFTYMGDLKKIFTESAAITADNGFFLFSVEESDNLPFILKATGRFGHSKRYIQSLCNSSGWSIIECTHSKLRKDKGEWINGFLFILRKQHQK